MKRTKIVATVGPASSSVDMLKSLVQAGVNVFRINFSHGCYDEHAQTLKNIRSVEKSQSRTIGVIGDLCGPKIRVGEIAGGKALLEEGKKIIIQRNDIKGTAERVSINEPRVIEDVKADETLLLDDGKIALKVAESRPDELLCEITVGGELLSHKGLCLPHTNLKLSALTDKDRRDAKWLAERDFDFVALSFVQKAQDIRELRSLLAGHNCYAHIIAKIEKPQALANIDAIIDISDCIMVARGDLGVEMDFPKVPIAQKRIVRKCQAAGKPCIVATEMLESMIDSPTPTRAEVSDVANAVLDHADAVMLSAESAIGKYPVQAVQAMSETVIEAQGFLDEDMPTQPVVFSSSPTTAAIASAVNTIIEYEDIKAVAVFTANGDSARMLAKNRPPCPIVAVSQNLASVRRMCLYYGVFPLTHTAPEHTRDILAIAGDYARQIGIANEGERIVVVSGRPIGKAGATNTIVVHKIKNSEK